MDSLLNIDYEDNMEKNGQMLKLETSATSHQKKITKKMLKRFRASTSVENGMKKFIMQLHFCTNLIIVGKLLQCELIEEGRIFKMFCMNTFLFYRPFYACNIMPMSIYCNSIFY